MRVSALFLLVTLGVVSLASCSKIDDDKLADDPKTTISVINAGPDTLNIYQKGTRLNSGSNLLPGGQYKDLEVSAGTTNFQFKKLRSAVTLIDAPFSIDLNKEYTMFVGGQSADKVFLLRDSIPTATPDSGTVSIRFVNASPIDGTLDVSISGGFDYRNLAFKSATQFVKVSSGKQVLSIRRTGDTTQIAKGTLTLANRYTYTLYTKGLLDGTGTGQFGARILVVKQN